MKSGSDGGRRGISSDPSKMWDRARRSLFTSSLFLFSFFFFTANSPHASCGSPATVYKGARVLEMMALAETRRKAEARRVSHGGGEGIRARTTLFILPPLRSRKHEESLGPSRANPLSLRRGKPSPLFSSLLVALDPAAPLHLLLLSRAYPRYISTGRGLATLTQKYTWRRLAKSAGERVVGYLRGVGRKRGWLLSSRRFPA